MNREHLHLLMNRAVDGVASISEREELARALKADPLLRAEFEDTETVNAATSSLFRQLALHEDFSKRVMRRIQGVEVPADAASDSLRLPALRPAANRVATVVSIHRRRSRIYAVVAFVSAAAALLLGIGVVTGFFAANTGEPTRTDTRAADGRRGVPDREELNRTGSSTRQPLPIDRKAPDGDSVDAPKPDPGVNEPAPESGKGPDEAVDRPEGGQPEQPVEPERRAEEPREKPEAPVKAQPEPTPEEVVEDRPSSEGEPEETVPRATLGRMLVLNGQVDLVRADGSLKRLEDDQAIFAGDRLRTKFNAVVMLQLAGGDITLGKDTEVSLGSDNALRLEECNGNEKGMLAVDRNNSHSGDAFEVTCGEYSLFLMNGAAVLERKRHGMDISKAVGFATLTHETFGSVLFPEDSGYEAEIKFGKEYETPKSKAVLLPAWSAETRAKAVMLAINGALTDRKFASGRERSWVNSNLPGKLDKLMMHSTTTDSIVEFLTNAIQREQLDGATIVKMTGEVENACTEVTELVPSVISHHAGRAALVAENFEQWRDYFYRLMRPPVEPKDPKNPTPVPDAGDPNCPADKKYKRVEEPQPRKVKPVPPEGTKEDPAKDPEEDPAGEPAEEPTE
jgi:hypothetical protein